MIRAGSHAAGVRVAPIGPEELVPVARPHDGRPGECVPQVGERVEVESSASAHDRVQDGRSPAAGVAPGEQVVLPPDSGCKGVRLRIVEEPTTEVNAAEGLENKAFEEDRGRSETEEENTPGGT